MNDFYFKIALNFMNYLIVMNYLTEVLSIIIGFISSTLNLHDFKFNDII